MCQLRVDGSQGFAQRGIQGIDGTVSFSSGMVDLAVDAYLDGCFGKDAAPLAVLNVDQEIDQLERRLVV